MIDLLAEGYAINELHNDESHARSFGNLVNVRDVWMVQRRGSFCLLNEACHTILIRRDACRENFECYAPIECCVPRTINFAHAACAERRLDSIAAEACSNNQRHKSKSSVYEF